ncbi:hypothetical protein CRE_08523 [Caenorhabditis remanei]|uniref:Uncharacterized protein n=1 Tax=Caenorhabditis remanei TaxID=31234 RepID=E3N6X4_CAERE|nr:hypothetical protein CRE_08523 [Caenorhabditis remanei]
MLVTHQECVDPQEEAPVLFLSAAVRSCFSRGPDPFYLPSTTDNDSRSITISSSRPTIPTILITTWMFIVVPTTTSYHQGFKPVHFQSDLPSTFTQSPFRYLGFTKKCSAWELMNVFEKDPWIHMAGQLMKRQAQKEEERLTIVVTDGDEMFFDEHI